MIPAICTQIATLSIRKITAVLFVKHNSGTVVKYTNIKKSKIQTEEWITEGKINSNYYYRNAVRNVGHSEHHGTV
jgi:hypothetical protein